MAIDTKPIEEAWKSALSKADAIRKEYEGKEADMPADVEAKFDEAMADSDKYEAELGKATKSNERSVRLATAMERANEPVRDVPLPSTGSGEGKSAEDQLKERVGRKALTAYVHTGRTRFDRDERWAKGLSEEEYKVMQVGLDEEGGYLVAPTVYTGEIIQDLEDEVVIRSLSRKRQVARGVNLGQLRKTGRNIDPSWTSEVGDIPEAEGPTFGGREMQPSMLTVEVAISMKMIDAPGIDGAAILREDLVEAFGIKEENAFINGSGAPGPLGAMVASEFGISTDRDVTSGTSTNLTADGLIDAQESLRTPYWRNARWVFNRQAVRRIRKLKSHDSQYIWQPGLQAGVPGLILGYPYVISDYFPSTFTTGQYVGMWGDFNNYLIVDSMQLQLQRLVELRARNSEVGFIGRMELDAQPIREQGFVRMKLA